MKYLVGETAATRLRDIIRRHDGILGSTASRGGSRQVCLVVVIDEADDDGFYPCIPTDYITEDGDWEDYDEARLWPANGETLQIGQRYLAIRAADGEYGSGSGSENLATFVTATPSGSSVVSDITGVCIDWDAQILTVEHTVRDALTGDVIAVFCVDNPDDCCTGNGTGTGVLSSCCLDDILPLTLCGTFFSGCDCMTGTQVTFTLNEAMSTGGFVYYDGVARFVDCSAPFNVFPLVFGCTPGDPATFFLRLYNGENFALSSVDCNPLTVSFDVPTSSLLNQPGCLGPTAITIVAGDCGGGSGTGSGTPGTPVATLCCPANDTPRVIFATVIGSGGCETFDGSYVLTYNEGDDQWNGGAVIDGNVLILNLKCFFDDPDYKWRISINCAALGTLAYADVVDCDLSDEGYLIEFTAVGGLAVTTCCLGGSFFVGILT